MTAALIDGKAIAADLRARVTAAVQRLGRECGITPGLAVVLVGDNAASEVYIGAKKKMTAEAGMRSTDYRLPASASQVELLALIAQLNGDRDVHGILVQLPLPPQIDPHQVIAAIDPAKDVDGFHPLNVGRIAIGLPALAPCTPLACTVLANSVHASLAGLEAGGDRPLDHRRQAARPASHRRQRDGDGGAFQDPGPACGVAAGRSAVRRDRPSRIRPRTGDEG
jgi:methylenetetrahydrofolate dehydrogenase (NADP+)/methenyltetrahydrofolate cyclohydrolase